MNFQALENKILNHERLSAADGIYLLTKAPLLPIGQLAKLVRNRKNPAKEVTFVLDSNPNYTNICDKGCHFCAFHRQRAQNGAYVLSVEGVMAKIEHARGMGATTILLQGGCHPELPFDYYVSLVEETRTRFPEVTPHFFSAPEILTMAKVSGQSPAGVLSRLKEAGQHTLPGGGAEILSDRIRHEISPLKGSAEDWICVHREAHRLGFLSTATMMFGHIEAPADIVEHWDRLRLLQDESIERNNGGGFTAFIPWSYKPGNTSLRERCPQKAGPVSYLRILAASRLYLDNMPHIQSSWFSEGKKTGQIALHFGADDFGGPLFEENVHAEAGFQNSITPDELIALVHGAGFEAVQRSTRYEKLITIT